METNAIDYTCPCGRTWKHFYHVEVKESGIVHLSRIVGKDAPPNDALCTCGKTAAGHLETPMPGYRQVVVKHLTPVQETPRYTSAELEQRYEEFVQYFIAQETAFISWDRMDAIEEVAAKLVELGYSVATWQAESAESQAKLLGVDPIVVPWEEQSPNHNVPVPSVGERYRLRREVDRVPYFYAQSGLVGTLIHCDEHLIRLQMEEDLTDEFDNCIEWYDYEPTFPLLKIFHEDCQLLSD